ncbi:MAG: DUF5996 family protein [Bacteroidota bacterium]
MDYTQLTFEENSLKPLPNSLWWEVRNEFHRAVQILAMMGRSYCPRHMEDEYATLRWDTEGKAMIGKWLNGAFRFEIDYWEYKLIIRKDEEVIATYLLAGKSTLQILEEMKPILIDYGFDMGKLKTEYPYKDLPPEVADQNKKFSPLDLETIKAFTSWNDQAYAILKEFTRVHGNVSEIRCWPHHFDLAILMTVDKEKSKTIGIGYVPADDHYDTPYFYLGPYPAPDVKLLPTYDGPGKWHTENWTGGILLSEELKGLSLPEQTKTFQSFYQNYLKSLIKLLA